MIQKKIEQRDSGLIKNTNIYTQSPKEGKSALKLEELESTTVTTTGGKEFDADEIAQSRILRAIKTLELKGESSIQWKLADNSVQEVNLEELREAFTLSFDKQYQLWLS